MLARTTSQVIQQFQFQKMDVITNGEKIALLRGTVFTTLIIHIFLPLMTKLQQYVTVNIFLANGSAGYNMSSRMPSSLKDLDVYHHFLSQDDYYSVEFTCWMALLIVTLVNQADLSLVNFRHPYLRGTTFHTCVVTVKKYLMAGIILASINCLIISWMRTKSCDTVIMLPWRKLFNPCAVATELITNLKFVFSILVFSSLVSEYPTLFGTLLRKRSYYGLGYEEIVLFLLLAGISEITNTCNTITLLTLKAAFVFARVVFCWNLVSILWNILISDGMTFGLQRDFMEIFMLRGPNQRIPSDELNSDPRDQIPEDSVRLVTTEDKGEIALIISEDKADDLSLIAKFKLESKHQSGYFELKTNNAVMYTSLAHLQIKRMAWPTNIQYKIFNKNDINELYNALSKCFEPLTKTDFVISLYKENGTCFQVGLCEELSFCVRIEDVKNKQLTAIYPDVEDTEDGPPATVKYYQLVDWPYYSKIIYDIIFRQLNKLLHKDIEPPATGEQNE